MPARIRKKKMHDMGLPAVVALCALFVALGCSSVPASPKISPPADEFSSELVDAHFAGLAGIGPRWPGDASDAAAREYLAREFDEMGAVTRTLDVGARRHLLVEIAGVSRDSLLLVTPLQALGSSAWVDDAGPAVFLELVRVLGAEPPPYTLRFALAATDASQAAGEEGQEGGWKAPEDPLEARALIFEAGRSLVEEMARRGELDGVRAVVALEPRARPRPRMARDLRSHPVFREVFWAAADALGETDTFPTEASWSSPEGLHAAFQAHGLNQVVALVDETTARAELQAEMTVDPRGKGEGGAAVGGNQTSGLYPVGRVTLEGLARLMKQFEKVDAFSP